MLRELTDKARLERIAVGSRQTIRDLGEKIGVAGARQLADNYLKECSAEVGTGGEAEAFEQWFADRHSTC